MKPALAPLKTLYETKRGKALPLPPRLARLYGPLCGSLIDLRRGKNHLFLRYSFP